MFYVEIVVSEDAATSTATISSASISTSIDVNISTPTLDPTATPIDDLAETPSSYKPGYLYS